MSITDNSPNSGTQGFDPIASVIGLSTNVKNNVRSNDFPDGFQIIEYVLGVAQPNPIKLVGNMMPMQPFPWELEQRLVKEYYPGNPEAAVQVLGPKWGPLTIHGRFKDKRYKDTSLYGVSYQFAELLDELNKRGSLLKFGMSGPSGSWWRYGMLEKNSWKLNKLSWIDYDLTFFIVSDKLPVNNYFAADEKLAPDAFNQKLIAAAIAFNQNFSTVPSSMPISVAGLINSGISAVAGKINLVTGFVQGVLGSVENVEASAHRALGLIKNTRQTIHKMVTQIDSISHSFSSHSKQGSAKGKTIDTYQNLIFIHEAISSAHQLSSFLAKMQLQFEKLALTVPKARYKVVSGDTLQNISIKFYGISDNWERIKTHNNLQTTQLTAGTILEIPNL